MHYYSFNIKDYRKDTQHLKPIEHYIYRMLIDLYYMDEKPIPKKTQWVMRRLMLDSPEHETMLKNVLDDFFYECDEGFRHKRIDCEITKYHGNVQKNRENGKKGGRPRKNNPEITQSVTDGLPLESQNNPNQEPLTNNQEPLTNNQEPLTNINTQEWRDEKFESFYKLYPNKKGLGQAKKTWNDVFTGKKDHEKPSNPVDLFETIINAIKVQTPKILASEERFRKHPSTWLNAQAWLDEVNTQQPQLLTSNRTTPDPLAVNAKWNVPTKMTDEEKRQWLSGDVDKDIPGSFTSDNNNYG